VRYRGGNDIEVNTESDTDFFENGTTSQRVEQAREWGH
jgi:hypothetical protein